MWAWWRDGPQARELWAALGWAGQQRLGAELAMFRPLPRDDPAPAAAGAQPGEAPPPAGVQPSEAPTPAG
eukprot:11228326-Lingulodinium_polyedra.AAC.1